mmetsp:Transcript_15435/g.17897  ORF Transcript_15435/g.17897 Transcript_15435/m.17897 type:complete len:132 (+) Transcript_15435:575-970(+)
MYESRFQKVSNLIMETGISIIFVMMYYFQNVNHATALCILAIAVIFISQFLIMMLTLSKGIKDVVIWYQKRKKVIMASSTMTEKSIVNKVYEAGKLDYMQTKTSSLKPIQEEMELEEGLKYNMPIEESKGS